METLNIRRLGIMQDGVTTRGKAMGKVEGISQLEA